MANNGFLSRISGFFSNNVAQAVNTASAEGQFGFININQMQSTDIDLEKNITENVAGYGKQLGRIVNALRIVVEHSQFTGLMEDEQAALRKFSHMVEEIDAVRRIHAAPMNETVERIVENILHLREHDPTTYEQILDRLRLRTDSRQIA